jgi:hypothetical protein
MKTKIPIMQANYVDIGTWKHTPESLQRIAQEAPEVYEYDERNQTLYMFTDSYEGTWEPRENEKSFT